jgi:TonB family protein
MNRRSVAWRSILTAALSTVLFFPSRAQSELLQQASATPAPSSATDPVRSDIVEPGKGMSAPILIHFVSPDYPAVSAQKSGRTETVTVSCYIERDGTTSNVHTVRSGPNDLVSKSLRDSAVESVKHYKYKPAQKDGKPVPVKLDVVVSFER